MVQVRKIYNIMLTEQIEDACIYIIVLVIVIAISTTVMADKSLFAQVVMALGAMTGSVMIVRAWRNNS
ncbi:hypothetical protein FKV73_03060 [Weissella paramesenteroides]|nr:hypothetical protein FKV79_04410 [Weissella paramesenteroides]KAA8438664.1 hypothetical protein FKV73_03060 [Weissella paramesenteroides]MBU7568725.1 hypothetical protein [Weissella hellenica]QDJ58964.1 hypothetical protein EFA59_05230 [Weissella hellenica]QEA57961.1 hypothetical protein FGL75_08755 [Weissella hellenica]